MDALTPAARERYDAVVGAGADLVVGADFDGTLAPIVPDPERAFIHPDAPAVLGELGRHVRAVAVITGRPVAQVLELGGLEEVADDLGDDGRLVVLGQYGNQRWASDQREITTPEPPAELARFRELLPGLLRDAGTPDAWVEDKGLAVALHTRRLPDPRAAYERLRARVQPAAEELGLGVEPGRNVVEVRVPGTHKGLAVRELRDELDAGGFVFVGDDLGDVEAFRAVAELRDQGMAGLLVCSASEEEAALAELADLVVDGPDGVMAFLRGLTHDLGSTSADASPRARSAGDPD